MGLADRARLLLLVAMLGFLFAVSAPGAAACEAFRVEVTPDNASEGASVTVKVTRDGAAHPSSVTVRTIEGSATAGRDFAQLDETVRFDKEVSRAITLRILDDEAVEGDETFRVGLSNPSGCAIDTDYTLSSDADVTIVDGDARTQDVPTETVPRLGAAAGSAAGPGDGASSRDTDPSAERDAASRSASAGDDSGSPAAAATAVAAFGLALALLLVAAVRRRRREGGPEPS